MTRVAESRRNSLGQRPRRSAGVLGSFVITAISTSYMRCPASGGKVNCMGTFGRSILGLESCRSETEFKNRQVRNHLAGLLLNLQLVTRACVLGTLAPGRRILKNFRGGVQRWKRITEGGLLPVCRSD